MTYNYIICWKTIKITYYSDGSFFAANIWYVLFGRHRYIKTSPILHESPGHSIRSSRLVTVEFRWAQLRCSYPPRPFEAGSLPAGALCYDNSSAPDLDTRSHSKEIDVEMMRQREGIGVYVVTFVEHNKKKNYTYRFDSIEMRRVQGI